MLGPFTAHLKGVRLGRTALHRVVVLDRRAAAVGVARSKARQQRKPILQQTAP